MEQFVSPKYMMKLIPDIEKAIWNEFKSYKDVRLYIDKWHQEDSDWNNHWENFSIKEKKDGTIDLSQTLHKMDQEMLLQIAVDMGVDTPDFIPSIATFRNEIKSDYKTASETFEKAFRQIEEHPDIAIGLANSALESIIKEILKDERIRVKYESKSTLYDLTSSLLKEFRLFPQSDLPVEVNTIGSSLLSINQSIEKIRSEKTIVHGKTNDDYVIADSVYTYFMVNSVATVGLFLKSYYMTKYPKPKPVQPEIPKDDDLPF